MRISLLIAGFILLIMQKYFQPLSAQWQFGILIMGVLLLGVPHGAADLLVATRNTANNRRTLSKSRFLFVYLSRLVMFAVFIWLFPLTGILLFIVFAAFHFGETDLYRFNINNISGVFFVSSYGLMILGVMLLNHFEEVRSLFQVFDLNARQLGVLDWFGNHRVMILGFLALLFFVSAFNHFLLHGAEPDNQGGFLIRFCLIMMIVFYLPMTLGFTFYFICWHSVLSLRNIVRYLRRGDQFKRAYIVRQIAAYSLLALTGITLFGISGLMLMDHKLMTLQIMLGLAVLTAPHMQVMHDMYKYIRYPKLDIQKGHP